MTFANNGVKIVKYKNKKGEVIPSGKNIKVKKMIPSARSPYGKNNLNYFKDLKQFSSELVNSQL